MMITMKVISLNNTLQNKITQTKENPCGKVGIFIVLCPLRTDARLGTQWMLGVGVGAAREGGGEELFHKTTRLGTPVAGAKFLCL